MNYFSKTRNTTLGSCGEQSSEFCQGQDLLARPLLVSDPAFVQWQDGEAAWRWRPAGALPALPPGICETLGEPTSLPGLTHPFLSIGIVSLCAGLFKCGCGVLRCASPATASIREARAPLGMCLLCSWCAS